jgi:hypothetical protein
MDRCQRTDRQSQYSDRAALAVQRMIHSIDYLFDGAQPGHYSGLKVKFVRDA